MAYLKVKDIYKKFGDTEVLKGVSFTLDKCGVLSLIGSSGSGKTTLLRCINGLETADGGTITVDGKQVFPLNEQEDDVLTFGLVFQNFNLFPQYTALENVTLALDMHAKRKAKKDKNFDLKAEKEKNKELALGILKNVGLIDKANNYPCELSGGQQQRVAIARALALKPKVLCFDEPTSALDPELTGEVLKVIKELKNTDMTMLIVTHEMEFAKNISDKVVFMADGVIAESGTPEQVFNDPQNELTKNFLKNYLEKQY